VIDQYQDGLLVLDEDGNESNDRQSSPVIRKAMLGKNWLCGLHCLFATGQMQLESFRHSYLPLPTEKATPEHSGQTHHGDNDNRSGWYFVHGWLILVLGLRLRDLFHADHVQMFLGFAASAIVK
jgi:hypothetical protein